MEGSRAVGRGGHRQVAPGLEDVPLGGAREGTGREDASALRIDLEARPVERGDDEGYKIRVGSFESVAGSWTGL